MKEEIAGRKEGGEGGGERDNSDALNGRILEIVGGGGKVDKAMEMYLGRLVSSHNHLGHCREHSFTRDNQTVVLLMYLKAERRSWLGLELPKHVYH